MQTITTWRTSPFGDPDLYPWTNPPTGASSTHVTAYNCALRFSDDTSYLNACLTALGHKPSGSTIFYSLLPGTIVNRCPESLPDRFRGRKPLPPASRAMAASGQPFVRIALMANARRDRGWAGADAIDTSALLNCWRSVSLTATQFDRTV